MLFTNFTINLDEGSVNYGKILASITNTFTEAVNVFIQISINGTVFRSEPTTADFVLGAGISSIPSAFTDIPTSNGNLINGDYVFTVRAQGATVNQSFLVTYTLGEYAGANVAVAVDCNTKSISLTNNTVLPTDFAYTANPSGVISSPSIVGVTTPADIVGVLPLSTTVTHAGVKYTGSYSVQAQRSVAQTNGTVTETWVQNGTFEQEIDCISDCEAYSKMEAKLTETYEAAKAKGGFDKISKSLQSEFILMLGASVTHLLSEKCGTSDTASLTTILSELTADCNCTTTTEEIFEL